MKESTLSPRYLFISPPSMEQLEERLRGRGTETEESIQKRLGNAAKEIDYGQEEGNFDRIFVNNDLDETFAVMTKEFQKWYPQHKDVDYELLRKKLTKVQRILKELEDEHGEDVAKRRKDYAKYLKKQGQYSAILEGENEKEDASGSDDISASGISLEDDESKENPDMKETQAKYDKVKNVLKQLEKKYGKQDAKKREDYQRYEKKKWKYFAILDKHDSKGSSASSSNIEKVNIIIAGAPASGKGTQCEVIKEKFGVVHLSTGDMLRAAVAAGTDVGKKAKDFMDNGKLVPDEVIIAIVSTRLSIHIVRHF